MTRELFWLTLTVILTGLMWVPYVLNRCKVRGLGGAMANPSRNDESQAHHWGRQVTRPLSRSLNRQHVANLDTSESHRHAAHLSRRRRRLLPVGAAVRLARVDRDRGWGIAV